MSDKETINARLREYLPRLRSGNGDTAAQAEQAFRDEFSESIRALAVAKNPWLEGGDNALSGVTAEAFRLILERARSQHQPSLTLSDFEWAIWNACINQRLATYLPYLQRGEQQTEFYLEFHDDAVCEARRIIRHRDPNNVANLQEDDVESSVDNVFCKIFARARVGCLPKLTWAYIKRAIFLELTPMLRRGWRDAGRRGAMPAALPDDPDFEGVLTRLCDAVGLTDQQHQVLRWIYCYAMTLKEAGLELGVSDRAVRDIRRSALRKLRDWLTGNSRDDPNNGGEPDADS
jgi:hypothetical protein